MNWTLIIFDWNFISANLMEPNLIYLLPEQALH